MAGKQNHPLKTNGHEWDADAVIDLIEPILAKKSLSEALNGGVEIDGQHYGLPTYNTLYKIFQSRPDLQSRVARARRIRAETLAEEALTILDAPVRLTSKGITDTGAVRHAEARARQRNYLAERLDPEAYGQRVGVDLNVHGEIDIVSVLQEARGRVIQGVVEHPAIEQDADDDDGLDLVG